MPERTLVTIGDDCVLNAGSVIQCHSLEEGAFKSDATSLGAGTTVGVEGFVHYGVTMGDGSVLDADSFLMKGSQVDPHARWQGNPAREVRGGPAVGAVPTAWTASLPRDLLALPVATTDPYGVVGVSPSIYLPRDPTPPYVPRDADAALDRALGGQRFVLVVGDSKAGKSRSAFEAVRRRFPASQLLVPTGGESVAALLRDPPVPAGSPPAVLWLDELHRFLGDASGFDRELLAWLQRPDPDPLVVVATIDSRRRDDLRRIRGGIGWAPRRILELAAEVPVPARLSDAERAEAERRYPEVDLDRGIGAALSAAPALEWRFDLGAVAAPVGRAMVEAAVDWHRTGMAAPIAEPDLRALSRSYLRAAGGRRRGRRADAEGLAWAEQPVAPGVALLRRAGRGRRYVAADHLVALAARKAGGFASQVAPAAWELAVARASAADAVRVGFTAYASGNHQVAAAAWSRASESGHPEAAPWAAVNLGLLRGREGDVEGAAAAFERARASRHPEVAPWAAVHLGLLLGRLGETDAAAATFEQARGSGHPEAAPWAAVNLGLLRRRLGDLEGAAAAFEEAVASGRADAARCALANLRQLPLLPRRPVGADGTAAASPNGAAPGDGGLLAWPDVEAARRTYERAIASGDPDAAPRAAIDLGVLLAVQGDVDGARVAFARAASSGHREAPWAVIGLGLLLEALGDRAYARDAYRFVVESGHAQAAPVADRHLKALAEEDG